MLAVVPLKLLDAAKQRLSDRLSAVQRRALTLAMAEDVLAAVAQSSHVTDCLLVSRNIEAEALAERHGARCFREPQDANLPGALQAAIASLARDEQAGGAVILPADLPLLLARDIDALIDCHHFLAVAGPAVSVVADDALSGTNALALTPATAIDPIFDGQSFRPHLASAVAHGVTCQALRFRNFKLDIDRPADLDALLNARPDGNAGRLLRSDGFGGDERA
ncbi:MAG: 2-phospho-L-lactate guanylyltransferase [Pseudomonadota bacterium]